jgi:hypothetical protein
MTIKVNPLVFYRWLPCSWFIFKYLKTIKYKLKRWSFPCNMPWSPIVLQEVDDPIFSRQSVYRWRWGYQPYGPAALYPPERFLVLLSVKRPSRLQGQNAAGRIRSNEKSSDFIGNGTHDLPACSIVPQSTTLKWSMLCNCVVFHKSLLKCHIWESHDGGNVECCLLEYDIGRFVSYFMTSYSRSEYSFTVF